MSTDFRSLHNTFRSDIGYSHDLAGGIKRIGTGPGGEPILLYAETNGQFSMSWDKGITWHSQASFYDLFNGGSVYISSNVTGIVSSGEYVTSTGQLTRTTFYSYYSRLENGLKSDTDIQTSKEPIFLPSVGLPLMYEFEVVTETSVGAVRVGSGRTAFPSSNWELDFTTGNVSTQTLTYNSSTSSYDASETILGNIAGLTLSPNSTNRVIVCYAISPVNSSFCSLWVCLNGIWLTNTPTNWPATTGFAISQSSVPGLSTVSVSAGSKIRLLKHSEYDLSNAFDALPIQMLRYKTGFSVVGQDFYNDMFDVGHNGRIGGVNTNGMPFYSDNYGFTNISVNLSAETSYTLQDGYIWHCWYMGDGRWMFLDYADYSPNDTPPIYNTGYTISRDNLQTCTNELLPGLWRSDRYENNTDFGYTDGIFGQGILRGENDFLMCLIAYPALSPGSAIDSLTKEMPYDVGDMLHGFVTKDKGETWELVEIHCLSSTYGTPFQQEDYTAYGTWYVRNDGKIITYSADLQQNVLAFETDINFRSWRTTPTANPRTMSESGYNWFDHDDGGGFVYIGVPSVYPERMIDLPGVREYYHIQTDLTYETTVQATSGLVAYWPLTSDINRNVDLSDRLGSTSIASSGVAQAVECGPLRDQRVSGIYIGKTFDACVTSIPTTNLVGIKTLEFWYNAAYAGFASNSAVIMSQINGWSLDITSGAGVGNDLNQGWHYYVIRTDATTSTYDRWVDGIYFGQNSLASNRYLSLINSNSPIYLVAGPGPSFATNPTTPVTVVDKVSSLITDYNATDKYSEPNLTARGFAEIAAYNRLLTPFEIVQHHLVGRNLLDTLE